MQLSVIGSGDRAYYLDATGSPIFANDAQLVVVETTINGKPLLQVGVEERQPPFSGLQTNYQQQSLVKNRWADPICGDGVSGAPWDYASTSGRQVINNSASLLPGPTATFGGMRNSAAQYPVAYGTPGCSWELHNCGPNSEPFSLHAGNGCFAGFADGAVKFLSQKTDVQVIRQVCDPADGEQPLPY